MWPKKHFQTVASSKIRSLKSDVALQTFLLLKKSSNSLDLNDEMKTTETVQNVSIQTAELEATTQRQEERLEN